MSITSRTGRLVVAAAVMAGGVLAARPAGVAGQDHGNPVASLEPAPALTFAGDTDSNSPAVWSLVGGRRYLHVVNSVAGRSLVSRGLGVGSLAPVGAIKWSPSAPPGGAWFEAIVPDPAGTTWFGYYHNERENVVCPGSGKVLPSIGAARSSDRGVTWRDLGTVLEAPPSTEWCDTANHYFVGGVGDFSVMLDRDQKYLYVFYTQYFEAGVDVGVSVARMNWADRSSPKNRMQVWNGGAWLPGNTRRVTLPDGRSSTLFVYRAATPFVKAPDPWDSGTARVDVFWGPSVHWNTALGMYVMLLNRAADEMWAQEGVYVSYAPSLDDPRAWTTPAKLVSGGVWYPQVIGLEADGTDKLASGLARFFMGGRSDHVIRFGWQ